MKRVGYKVLGLVMGGLGLVLLGVCLYFLLPEGRGLCIRRRRITRGLWYNCTWDILDKAKVPITGGNLTNLPIPKPVLGEKGKGMHYRSGWALGSLGGMGVAAVALILEMLLAAIWLCQPGSGRKERRKALTLACIAFIGHALCALGASAVALSAASFSLYFQSSPYTDPPYETRTAYVTITSFAIAGIISAVNGLLGFIHGILILVYSSPGLEDKEPGTEERSGTEAETCPAKEEAYPWSETDQPPAIRSVPQPKSVWSTTEVEIFSPYTSTTMSTDKLPPITSPTLPSSSYPSSSYPSSSPGETGTFSTTTNSSSPYTESRTTTNSSSPYTESRTTTSDYSHSPSYSQTSSFSPH